MKHEDIKMGFETSAIAAQAPQARGLRARFGALLGSARTAVADHPLSAREAVHLLRNYEEMSAGWGRVRQGGVISAVAVGHRQAALAVMCRG